MFTDSNGGTQLRLRNHSFDSIPFSTPRLLTNRDAVTTAAETHCAAAAQRLSLADDDDDSPFSNKGSPTRPIANASVHPDAEFVRSTFGWLGKGGSVGEKQVVDIEPPPLWGTFASEAWTSCWSRELGLAHYRCARLTPEIVSIASTDAAKLRAARKYVQNRIG